MCSQTIPSSTGFENLKRENWKTKISRPAMILLLFTESQKRELKANIDDGVTAETTTLNLKRENWKLSLREMKEELESRVPGISKERIESLAVALRMISQLLHVESQKRELKDQLVASNHFVEIDYTNLKRENWKWVWKRGIVGLLRLLCCWESQKRELKEGKIFFFAKSVIMQKGISKERIERLALEPTEKLNVEVKESQKRELKGDNRV